MKTQIEAPVEEMTVYYTAIISKETISSNEAIDATDRPFTRTRDYWGSYGVILGA